MNTETLVELSGKLRARYGLCLDELRETGVDCAKYDNVFWGAPSDWEETTDACQYTLANLLFTLGSPDELTPPEECEYPRVFASFLDGCYTVFGHAGALTDWKEYKKLEAFQENEYRIKLSGYAGNSPESARWILVGASNAKGHLPPRFGGKPRVIKRSTPCLDGVSLHVDLTWDALSLHIRSADGTLRSLVLHWWGLGVYLKSIAEDFVRIENAKDIKEKLLAKKMAISIPGEVHPRGVQPSELMLDAYVNRLRHLLPYSPESDIRLTGWFAGKLLQEEVEAQLGHRYANITFGYPYKNWKYE